LVLVARSADKLDEIKKELEAQYGINVKVIAKGTVQRIKAPLLSAPRAMHQPCAK
jgi:short-subunit dehydrogenase